MVNLKLVILGALAWAVSVPAYAADLVPKKKGVKVFAEASKDAKVVATLDKGEGIETKSRQGMYWQIETENGVKGFVSVLDVKRKSGDESTGLAKAIRAAASEGRVKDEVVGARARSAVMGVRGAMADEETAGAGQVKPNLRYVYAMEDMQISKKKIDSLGKKVMAEVAKRTKTGPAAADASSADPEANEDEES